MKKINVLLCVFFACILLLSGCKGEENNKETVFNNDNFPSFSVENVQTSSGEDVTVFVELKDNPGFLTMAAKIEFDSKAMALMDVKCGSDYQDYNFVGPKNRGNGCCASLFIPELPEKNVDGKLLELHFKIFSDTKEGDYQIKISRPDNGGIVDGNKNALVINNAVGYVTVK